MTLNKETRQNEVLEAIIRTHFKSALPVSSREIARSLGLSSATIRNVMFELEKEGFIKQPHTSAGRLPTDLGYRRYVDSIMSLTEPERESLHREMQRYVVEKKFFEEVIESASRAISHMTNYTGIAVSPSNKLYFDGTYHMLEQPEFSELGMMRDFLKAIEEREELLRLMSGSASAKGTIIRIGRENTCEELRECTVITSTYKVNKRPSGNIGVIGPMRMHYEEIVPIVEGLAEMTTEALEEIL